MSIKVFHLESEDRAIAAEGFEASNGRVILVTPKNTVHLYENIRVMQDEDPRARDSKLVLEYEEPHGQVGRKRRKKDEMPGFRVFHLHREVDESGVSGTGRVAEGFEASIGRVCLVWLTHTSSVNFYDNMKQVESIHGHGGNTTVVLDYDPKPLEIEGQTPTTMGPTGPSKTARKTSRKKKS